MGAAPPLREAGPRRRRPGRRVHLVRAHRLQCCGIRGEHHDPAALRTQRLHLIVQGEAREPADAFELAWPLPVGPAEGREHDHGRIPGGEIGVLGRAHASVDVVDAVDDVRGGAARQCGARRDGVGQLHTAVAVEGHQLAGVRVQCHQEHRALRPVLSRQPGGDERTALVGARAQHGVALQTEGAHRPPELLGGAGRGTDGAQPLEELLLRDGRRSLRRTRRPLGAGGAHGRDQRGGVQLGRRHTAAHRRGRGGTRRGADDQVGAVGEVEAAVGEAGDDAQLPGVAGGSATAEDERDAARGMGFVVAGHVVILLSEVQGTRGSTTKALKASTRGGERPTVDGNRTHLLSWRAPEARTNA